VDTTEVAVVDTMEVEVGTAEGAVAPCVNGRRETAK